MTVSNHGGKNLVSHKLCDRIRTCDESSRRLQTSNFVSRACDEVESGCVHSLNPKVEAGHGTGRCFESYQNQLRRRECAPALFHSLWIYKTLVIDAHVLSRQLTSAFSSVAHLPPLRVTMEGDCAGKGAVALTLAARRAWPQRLELSVSFQGRGAVQCARAVPHFVALPREACL